MFIINTYTVKHTLYRGLNRLQMYVREIKEKQIFKRIRWQLRILLNICFLLFLVIYMQAYIQKRQRHYSRNVISPVSRP